MKWLEDFKLALIEEDFTAIETLIDDIPEFPDIDSSKLALTFIEQAREVISKQKNEALLQMQKIQKTKKFIKEEEGVYSLDMSY